jgi:hypothetical protein
MLHHTRVNITHHSFSEFSDILYQTIVFLILQNNAYAL